MPLGAVGIKADQWRTAASAAFLWPSGFFGAISGWNSMIQSLWSEKMLRFLHVACFRFFIFSTKTTKPHPLCESMWIYVKWSKWSQGLGLVRLDQHPTEPPWNHETSWRQDNRSRAINATWRSSRRLPLPCSLCSPPNFWMAVFFYKMQSLGSFLRHVVSKTWTGCFPKFVRIQFDGITLW